MRKIHKLVETGFAVSASLGLLILGCAAASATPVIAHHWTFDDYPNQTLGGNATADSGDAGGLDAYAGFYDADELPTTSGDVPLKISGDTLSMQFDGMNYLSFDRVPATNFSYCAWIKTTSAGPNTNHWNSAPIVDAEVPTWAHDYGFGIGENGRLLFGTGGLEVGTGNEGTDYFVLGQSAVNNNQWHNVCATRNGTTGAAVLYVDGKQDGQGFVGTGDLSDADYVFVGNGQDGNSQFVGLIDDLRYYGSILTPTEVSTIANGDIPLPSLAGTGVSYVPEIATGFVLLVGGLVMVFARKSQRRSGE